MSLKLYQNAMMLSDDVSENPQSLCFNILMTVYIVLIINLPFQHSTFC